jgi:hypothetical protein
MRLRVLATLCVVLALGLAGCRQSDGPLPKEEGEVPNRLDDLSRDLTSVVGGDRQAPQDLADDLVVFVPRRESEPAARELASRTATAVAGSKLSAENARTLASHLWVAVAATDLSGKQVEKLQADLKSTLTSAGVPDQTAQGVSDQVKDVQKVVTTRSRRWYEFF